MYTNEQRLAAMHRRASEIKKEERRKKVLLARCAVPAAGLMIAVAVAAAMPGLRTIPELGPGGMSGSIFAGSASLGYIVTGITAFLLGSAATAFCFCLGQWQKRREEEDDARDRND